MGFLNKEIELILPPKKQINTINKTINIKSLNCYYAIRDKLMKVTHLA